MDQMITTDKTSTWEIKCTVNSLAHNFLRGKYQARNQLSSDKLKETKAKWFLVRREVWWSKRKSSWTMEGRIEFRSLFKEATQWHSHPKIWTGKELIRCRWAWTNTWHKMFRIIRISTSTHLYLTHLTPGRRAMMSNQDKPQSQDHPKFMTQAITPVGIILKSITKV